MSCDLKVRILKANVEVHRYESKHYELLHPEIYNAHEQKRLSSWIMLVDKIIKCKEKTALDIGAGTGNLTSKLLRLGYKVTALDVSIDMCAILRNKYKKYIDAKRLRVLNQSTEDVSFKKNEFALICCYSVLHHLPDYVSVIRKLATPLKRGGVMFLDHEASPFEWSSSSKATQEVKRFFIFSNRFINMQYFRMLGVQIPPSSSLDYKLSDYWGFKEHHIDHKKIELFFKQDGFDFFTRIDYHSYYTWVFNPIFYIYKHTCKPEVSCWIARK